MFWLVTFLFHDVIIIKIITGESKGGAQTNNRHKRAGNITYRCPTLGSTLGSAPTFLLNFCYCGFSIRIDRKRILWSQLSSTRLSQKYT